MSITNKSIGSKIMAKNMGQNRILQGDIALWGISTLKTFITQEEEKYLEPVLTWPGQKNLGTKLG